MPGSPLKDGGVTHMTAYAVVITFLLVFPWAVVGVMGSGAAVTHLRLGRPIERRHTRDARDRSNATIPELTRTVPARAGAR